MQDPNIEHAVIFLLRKGGFLECELSTSFVHQHPGPTAPNSVMADELQTKNDCVHHPSTVLHCL